MIIIDHEQGMACDIAEIWEDNADDGFKTMVTMNIGDEEEFYVQYKNEQGKTITVYFPLERLKKLLEGAAQ